MFIWGGIGGDCPEFFLTLWCRSRSAGVWMPVPFYGRIGHFLTARPQERSYEMPISIDSRIRSDVRATPSLALIWVQVLATVL